MVVPKLELKPYKATGGCIEEISPGTWRLSIPSGPCGEYRWAQLDNYRHLPRKKFAYNPPLNLALKARVSTPDLQGTWGFGFWNDPLSASIGLGGMARRLPALPNTAWFFHASAPNYLTFRDHHPAQGFLTATFASPLIPSLLLGFGIPFLPFLAWRVSARLFRKLIRILVQEDAVNLVIDPTEWHQYRMEWLVDKVVFLIDGIKYISTPIVPRGRLGLVIWIDNQFAAFPPDGRFRFGTLNTIESSWLEVGGIEIW